MNSVSVRVWVCARMNTVGQQRAH